MLRLLLCLMLFLQSSAYAQGSPPHVDASVERAALPVEEMAPDNLAEWGRIELTIAHVEGSPQPRIVMLMGFDRIDSVSGRPQAGALPIYEEVLVQDQEVFPLELGRWLRRDLNWYVLSGESMPLEQGSWMSDPLDLSVDSVELALGSEPALNVWEDPGARSSETEEGEVVSGQMGWTGLLLLGGIPVLLGWLIGREKDNAAASLRQVAIHALVAGLLFAFLSDLWLVSYHLDNRFTSPNLFESCDGVLSLQGEAEAWPVSRSRFAGAMPALIASWAGVLGGLRDAALLSACLVGAGIFVWARLLGGAVAGWVAVAAALTMGPLTHLPRMLSFYPEITAVLVWAGAAATWAVLRPGLRTAACAGAAMALCCLIDARGLPYAAVLVLGIGGWLGFHLRREVRWPLVALVMPMVLGWPLGRMAYPADAASLQAQLDPPAAVPEPVELDSEESAASSDPGDDFVLKPTDLVWGRTQLHELPGAGLRLLGAWPQSNPDLAEAGGERALETQVRPWWIVLVAGIPLAFGAVWRRNRTRGVVALGVSILPTLAALPLVLQVLVPASDAPSRFLTQLMPALAVCMGLGFVTLLHAVPGEGRFALGTWPRRGVLALIVCIGVAGWLPTPLSPSADWRYSWRADTSHEKLMQWVADGAIDEDAAGASCVRALRGESLSETSSP